jgi:hypothetical protein
MPGPEGHFPKIILPEASFIQVLRVAGALLEGGAGIDDLVSRIEERYRPTNRIAPMAIEILIRAGFAIINGDLFAPTDSLKLLDEALSEENLDEASRLWISFPPYNSYLNKLREKNSIEVSEIPGLLESDLRARPTIEACERLSRSLVFLGQAWTEKREGKDIICDGSARPEDKDMINTFSSLFAEKSHDGLCPIIELLPDLCRLLKISPWAASRQLQHLVQENTLPDYSFQPSAGKKITRRDFIVKGRLGGLQMIPVPLDRIQIGDRPIFTISRRS